MLQPEREKQSFEVSDSENPQKRTFISHIQVKGWVGPHNPGTAVWSFAAMTVIGKEYLHNSGYIGENVTNHVAEYRAIIEALRLVQERQWQNVVIQTGLRTIEYQLKDTWGVDDHLLVFYEEARSLLDKTHSRVQWIAGTSENEAAHYAKETFERARQKLLRPNPLMLLKQLPSTDTQNDEPPTKKTKRDFYFQGSFDLE